MKIIKCIPLKRFDPEKAMAKSYWDVKDPYEAAEDNVPDGIRRPAGRAVSSQSFEIPVSRAEAMYYM